MKTLETDYLVVGAGATGMAFTDALISESDADVLLVDRRHQPGGHWLDSYPFVRLHQPSAFYGVNSVKLGEDLIDKTGHNAGFYERATGAEICSYYERVLNHHFLPSGQVRFLGMTDYVGDGSGEHRIVSRTSGEEATVRVRRAFVDATYLESEIPARHTPTFEIDDGVQVIPPNGLVDLDDSASAYTVVGSGKTGMDTCIWLLDNGVPPDRIRWIKPRDAWTFNRATLQPLDQVVSVIEGVANEMEASALADGPEDLVRRLESCGRFVRIDTDIEPTMFRGATLSMAEVETLRSVENVVRMGRVHRVGTTEVVMQEGSVASEPGHMYIDCTARGLPLTEARPVFEDGRITVQTIRMGLTPFNAALVGYVEATRDNVEDKNRLTPSNPYTNSTFDWIPSTYISTSAEAIWGEEPDVAMWLERSRLNLAAGLRRHLDEPAMQTALTRLFEFRERGLKNLRRLMDEHAASATPAAI